jgi:Winged helix DNA-binding domain
MVASISRAQVLAFRVRAQQLDRTVGELADTAILDIGVQDTGPDGGLWALALRGVDASDGGDRPATVWSIRGAPHLYRREDLPAIAAAVEPFSDADAGKRIYNAAKPLKAAGVSNLAALDAVAAVMRSVVTKPMVKGDVSTRTTALVDPPYLRFCRPCQATHLYEMPFRLAALRAGLELRAGTSPPVLERIPGFKRATKIAARFDVVRAYLRMFGPATPKLVAAYLDAPVSDVKARWPADTVEVSVAGELRSVLAADEDQFGTGQVKTTRLLGPYDLFLQAKDRPLLVDDPAQAKTLWPVLGRPGAVLVDGEIAGAWRPRKSGNKFTVSVELWSKASASQRAAITEQAELLAQYRNTQLTGVDYA